MYKCLYLSFRGTKESQTELPGVTAKCSHCPAASNGEESSAHQLYKLYWFISSFYTHRFWQSCVFRKQSKLDRKERALPVMLVKRVLNQTFKSQRLKVRHRWLISRQNLLRKRRMFKSLKFPNKTSNLLTTASQILKYSLVRHLPLFCHCSYAVFQAVSSLLVFFSTQVNQKRVHSLIQTDKHMDPSRRYSPVLKRQAFTVKELSAWFDLAVQDHWFFFFGQFWFSEKPKRTEEKCCGGQEHVLCTCQIWPVTHTQHS